MITRHAGGKFSFVGAHGSLLKDAAMRAALVMLVRPGMREFETAFADCLKRDRSRWNAKDAPQLIREVKKLFPREMPNGA